MPIADQLVRYFDIAGMVLLYGWPFILLALIWGLKKKWSKHPIEAIIFEQRENNIIKTNDRLGKFDGLASDGIVYYQFKKTGDTIPVPPYEHVLHNNVVEETIFDKIVKILRPTLGTIVFYRYGSKQYKPIKINEHGEVLQAQIILDKEGKPERIIQHAIVDPRDQLKALNFDVVDWDNINFMVQEMRTSQERRKRRMETLLQFMVPALMIAGALVAGIFILKFSYDTGADLRAGSGQAPPEAPGGAVSDAISGVVTPN